MENAEFLTDQIITYLGNKRSLLGFIDEVLNIVKSELNKKKITTFDVFSGSGIVARLFKQHSKKLFVNDLEDYSRVLNECFLTNKKEIDALELEKWKQFLKDKITNKTLIEYGFFYKLYSPKDVNNIQPGERAFYTSRNAKILDTVRFYLDEVPNPYKALLLGSLLYEASTKTNTCGVFRGFYKCSKTNKGKFGGNAGTSLNRILADIEIKEPVLSNYSCETHIFQGDSNEVCERIPKVDLAYLDPPYNQHPYGSNYFMLNLIVNNKEPENYSKVSGIPRVWNKSSYNRKLFALSSLDELCKKLKARYILVSYNSEGFIKYDEMIQMLEKYGEVRVFSKKYNVFRGSRNLQKRNIHLLEYLFLLKKR